MNEDAGIKRPGGLTALAIINFVFAGMNLLGVLMFVGIGFFNTQILELMEGAATELNDPAAEKSLEPLRALVEAASNPIKLAIAIALSVAVLLLLIVSAFGYLKQERFRGRTLGSAYAIVALVAVTFTMLMMGMKFSILNMFDCIYPIVTLFLVNTTFKDDLVN